MPTWLSKLLERVGEDGVRDLILRGVATAPRAHVEAVRDVLEDEPPRSFALEDDDEPDAL